MLPAAITVGLSGEEPLRYSRRAEKVKLMLQLAASLHSPFGFNTGESVVRDFPGVQDRVRYSALKSEEEFSFCVSDREEPESVYLPVLLF